MQEIEADYVVVGAGCMGLSFADSLLTSDPDATIAIVDRRASPGGHWTEAYPFVRLHAPAAIYGVNSMPLGCDAVETRGVNAGLLDLASGAEIRDYFDQLMRERLLPSGRVRWLPLSDWREGGVVRSRTDGSERRLIARKRLVDATHTETQLPTSQPPAFAVAPGVRLVPPHHLGAIHERPSGWVVLGAGKTSMDTVVQLLEQGVEPSAITWVRPRDQWFIPREKMQPTDAFFEATIGAFAGELEVAANAASLDGLFEDLEAAGLIARIDRRVKPTMYRCAIVGERELDLLRQVETVVRLGRVTAIEPTRLVMEQGEISRAPGTVYVNCTADGIPKKPAKPVFADDRITLQYVRKCSPSFSAAFIAHVEAGGGSEAEKNMLCRPIPAPDEPLDWLRGHLHEAGNRVRWAERPGLQAWVATARLDRFSGMIARAAQEGRPERMAILNRYRTAMKPGISRIAELLAAAEAPRIPEPA